MGVQSNLAQFSPRPRARGAFTLTEIAIVLGVIGLILGAIWAVASAVYANMRLEEAQQGITFTAQRVRASFAGSNQTGATASSENMTSPGMFIDSWSGAAGTVGNPWNLNPPAGSNWSYVIVDSAHPSWFAVELDNISPGGCTGLVGFYNSAAPVTAGGTIVGLIDTRVSATAATGVAPKVTGSNPLVTGGFAGPASCTGVGNTNSVAITFDMNQM